MNDFGKILVAFAAGAAVGAVVGVLFAPDMGTETRKKIAEQGKKIGESMKEKFRSGKQKFENLKEDINQGVKETMEEYA